MLSFNKSTVTIRLVKVKTVAKQNSAFGNIISNTCVYLIAKNGCCENGLLAALECKHIMLYVM